MTKPTLIPVVVLETGRRLTVMVTKTAIGAGQKTEFLCIETGAQHGIWDTVTDVVNGKAAQRIAAHLDGFISGLKAVRVPPARKTLLGGSLRIVLDAAEIVPNDPGAGAPAMVYRSVGRGAGREVTTATYWAALDGFIECELTAREAAWLEAQLATVTEFIEAHTAVIRTEQRLTAARR